MSLSFKETGVEDEVYKRIIASSCSPTSFIKDVLIQYFKNEDKAPKCKQQNDEIEDVVFE